MDEGDRTPRPQPRRAAPPTPPSGVRRVASGTQPVTPVSPQVAQRESQPGTARYRREHAVVLPLWSLALMILLVLVAVAGIVALVLSMGGSDAPDEPPVVVMRSAVPTERPASFPAVPVTPTLPPFADRSVQQPQGTFALAGPTLATPAISPTPRPVDIGTRVIVVDVGDQQLNVRDAPGVFGTVVIFRAQEGSTFNVVEGPQQVDGLTWWRVQSITDPTQTGWAAANYLQAPPTTDEG